MITGEGRRIAYDGGDADAACPSGADERGGGQDGATWRPTISPAAGAAASCWGVRGAPPWWSGGGTGSAQRVAGMGAWVYLLERTCPHAHLDGSRCENVVTLSNG
jgi:hypothetical protein